MNVIMTHDGILTSVARLAQPHRPSDGCHISPRIPRHTPPTRHAQAHVPATRPPTQPAAVPRTRPRPSPAGAEAGVRPSPAKGTRARAKGRRARREEAKGQAAARREGAVWSELRVAADKHARRAVETSRAGAAGAADAVALAPRPLEGPPLLSARAARSPRSGRRAHVSQPAPERTRIQLYSRGALNRTAQCRLPAPMLMYSARRTCSPRRSG